MMIQNYRSMTFAILLGSLALTLPAQKATPASAKPDKWVKDTVKAYKALIFDKKKSKDAQAIELIDEMLKKFETMHPSDKKVFAKGVAECFSSPRCKRKPTEDGIYRTAIKALSMAGKHGSPHLWKAFENKSKFKGREWINLRGDMLEHLGRTKDEKYVKHLLGEALKNPNDTLMAKAGGALKYFKDMKLKPRKELAKDLIKKFANIFDNANKNLDPGDLVRQTWQNRLVAVSDPWNTTLQALTKQHIRKPNDWNTFWNKNKGKNWDQPTKSRR